jgi:hypothetical protein
MCGSKDIHHDKNTLLKGIGLDLQFLSTTLHLVINTIGGRKCYVFIEEINTYGLSIAITITTLRGDRSLIELLLIFLI